MRGRWRFISDDGVGLVHSLLLGIVRAGTVLSLVET